ncbi:MAG: IS1595 family transposase [Pseudomonadota bacterium]|nr:IS1595 family transposase [Pseudomonadota bacterium]
MVTGAHTVFSCSTSFLNGRKCIFCGPFKTIKTSRGYVKRMLCGKQKSLTRLCREIAILQGFYQQQPAYRLASDWGLDAKTVTRVYQRLRMALFHTAELEGARLSGEIELDESYSGGSRKGQRGRGARGKSIVFGLLERDGRVYTKVVESVSAQTLMNHIQNHTRKGSVYHTDAFRGYQSLQRYGKHLVVNHSLKTL